MTHAARDSAEVRGESSGAVDSLGSGAAGIALLHIERAHAQLASWDVAHHHAAAMAGGSVSAHPDTASLYRGAPAVAFVLHGAREHGYRAALATLDHHVSTITRHRLGRAHERIERRQLPLTREFDLISGLTGLGALLLRRRSDDHLLRDVLAYLVRLTLPIRAHDGTMLPGWWCSGGPSGRLSHHWPGGHGNFGIAHGITGPLALLAIAARRGITVSGQPEAIDQICTWLDHWQQGRGGAARWPEVISARERDSGEVRDPGPGRPSWCYGTPGIARAQQLAGIVLADPRRQHRAEHALIASITDEHQLAKVTDASLCHGWAGLVHCVWRAATDPAAGPIGAAHLPDLRARLEQHLQHDGPPTGTGFLDGQTGIQLAQHVASTDTAPITQWDACLLIDS